MVRAKIVLMAAEGLDNDEIAARREIVSKWRERFFESGLAGFEESVPGAVDPRSFPP